MKGHEHFREAEQFASASVYAYQKWGETGKGEEFDAALWQQKQGLLHATLAGAVALSNLVKLLAAVDADLPEPSRAEPLVMCNAMPAAEGWTLNTTGTERCGLPISHGGLHEHDAGGGLIVSWSLPDPNYPDVSGGGVPYAPEPARPYVSNHTVSINPVYQQAIDDLKVEMPR